MQPVCHPGVNDRPYAMTLINSTLPPPNPKARNVHIIEARNFLLATCANVSEAVAALSLDISVWADPEVALYKLTRSCKAPRCKP
jgi:hypothetical protein